MPVAAGPSRSSTRWRPSRPQRPGSCAARPVPWPRLRRAALGAALGVSGAPGAPGPVSQHGWAAWDQAAKAGSKSCVEQWGTVVLRSAQLRSNVRPSLLNCMGSMIKVEKGDIRGLGQDRSSRCATVQLRPLHWEDLRSVWVPSRTQVGQLIAPKNAMSPHHKCKERM